MVTDAAVGRTEIVSWREDERARRADELAVEEPLEIRLAGCPVSVTMRTPGHDLDLAAGFLFTEGIIAGPGDIASLAHCPSDVPGEESQVVNANPTDPAIVDPDRWRRNFFAATSCGICGKASIEAVRTRVEPVRSELRVPHRVLYGLTTSLEGEQGAFGRTGGVHAAGLFTAAGQPVIIREDVGRHNAVDKVIGAALRGGLLPLHDYLLFVSGRVSFEIVQKAAAAGIPVVAAVSAPSTLAVDLAHTCGMTLVAFLRTRGDGGRFNVYTAPERIT